MGSKKSFTTIILILVACVVLATIAFAASNAEALEGTAAASEKEETVHVYVDSSGIVTRTEVTSILKNGDGLESIEDYTDASKIIDVEDEVGYTLDGHNIVWNAKGDDVTYTGSIERDLPVSISIEYFLNGDQVDPASIVGAEGTVKIRFDFENRSIDEAGICTPFTAILGIIFDEDSLKGIEVTNGKVVQDGDNSIVIGYALPGLKGSLESLEENIDIPEYVEITGTAGAFEMKSAIVMVTPSLLDELDASDLDTSGMESSVSALESGISQLVEGSSQLTDGLEELSSAMDSVESGARQLSEGAGQVAEGATALTDGLDQLKDGASESLSGSWQLKQAADALVSGIYILVEGDGQTTGGLKAAQAGASQISDGIESLVSGLTDSTKGLPAVSIGLETAAEALGNVPAAGKGADATIAVAIATIDAYAAKGDISEAAAADLKAKLSAAQAQAYADQATANAVADGLSTSKAGINQAITQLNGADVTNLVSSSKALASGLGNAVTGGQNALYGANQVAYGLGQLNYGLNATVDGLGSHENEGTLIGGASQVASGAHQVADSSSELAQAISAITDSLKSAASGALELTEGMQTYQSQGISQLAAAIRNDVVGTRNRIVEIADRGRAYDTFSGKLDATTGSVKFVYEIEGFTLD